MFDIENADKDSEEFNDDLSDTALDRTDGRVCGVCTGWNIESK
jgi:hypothetical protein